MASDAIDTAVVSRLSGDSTLSALLTGGVHFFALNDGTDPTPPFASVMLFAGSEVRQFRGRAWEVCRYLITVHRDQEETVPLSTLRQASARIDELLEGATFSIGGHTLLKSERERRYAGVFVFDEIEEYEDFLFIASFGGLYSIWAQAN